MAKYKGYDYSQGKFIPINFDQQILHGTFEHTLHYLIDNDLDLSAFDLRYKNDETCAPAYDPRILLKIVLYAYSKGITSSRKIADCCNENVSSGRAERKGMVTSGMGVPDRRGIGHRVSRGGFGNILSLKALPPS